MDMDHGVGIDCGEGQARWRVAKGEKWGICNSINNNKIKNSSLRKEATLMSWFLAK